MSLCSQAARFPLSPLCSGTTLAHSPHRPRAALAPSPRPGADTRWRPSPRRAAGRWLTGGGRTTASRRQGHGSGLTSPQGIARGGRITNSTQVPALAVFFGGRSHSGEHGHGTKQGKWRPDFKNPGRALQPLVAFLQEGGEGQATQISPPLSDGQGAGKGMPKHMDVLHWVSVRASQLLPLQVAHTGAEATRSGDLSGIRELGLQKEKGEVFFPLWRQIFMEAWAWRSCWRSFVA